MAKFPALPLWTDALIGDTFHLTPAQFGAYLRLLIVEWRTPDCSLPDDDGFLGRAVGDTKNWHRLKPVVMPYFTLGEDGRYRQKRLLDEHDSCSRYAARSSAGGTAKALRRLHRDSAKPVLNECLEAAPYSYSISNPKEETTTTAPAVVAVVGFDDFFKEMPRQWNRASSKIAYAKALTKTTPDVLLSAAKKYSAKAAGFTEQYTLPPAKWLDDERWKDFANGKVSAFESPEEVANQKRLKEKYYGSA